LHSWSTSVKGIKGQKVDAHMMDREITMTAIVRKATAVRILKPGRDHSAVLPPYALWQGDVGEFLDNLPMKPIFDVVITSPPYNIGKPYEKRSDLEEYLHWQSKVISKIVPQLKSTGSICWQVGNYVEDGEILPLDIEFAPIFRAHKLQLRNRIVWHFGHGLHTKRRFSGRYEVVMWYTKSKDYIFNLDAVRIRSNYPGKRRAGELSGNSQSRTLAVAA